jgi:hypothetical protein
VLPAVQQVRDTKTLDVTDKTYEKKHGQAEPLESKQKHNCRDKNNGEAS